MAFKSYREPFILKSRKLSSGKGKELNGSQLAGKGQSRDQSRGHRTEAWSSSYAQHTVSDRWGSAKYFYVEFIVLNTKSATAWSTNEERKPWVTAKRGHCL